jgi:hypothetical protein
LIIATAVYSCALGSHYLSPSYSAHHTSGLNIRIFWKSSQQAKEILGSHKNPNQSRYIRLIALSAAQLLCVFPLAIFTIYFNTSIVTLFPWISWDDTHFNYSFVGQIPSSEWRANPTSEVSLELSRWLVVLSAFFFFAFFGFAEEARKHYRLAFSFASSRLGLTELGSSRANNSSPNSPASSFGPGLKKGMATLFSFKDGFTALGSRNSQSGGMMTERKAFASTSNCRLTSDGSIFDGIDVESKGEEGFLPDDDDALSASTHHGVPMPVIPRVPVPPLPVANPAGFTNHIPPGRLDSPLPHRPASSYLDVPEDV